MRGKITAMIVTGCLMIATITTAWAANTKEATKTFNLGSTGVVGLTSDDGKTKMQVQVNYGAVKNYGYNLDSSSKTFVLGVKEYTGFSLTDKSTNTVVISANGNNYVSVDRDSSNSLCKYIAECDRYGVSTTTNLTSATLTDILIYNINQGS